MRKDVAAIGALVLLALAWSWPLASRLFIALPGSAAEPDVTGMLWNVGWVRQALETNAPLLRSDEILLPFGADLRLHAYGLFLGLLVWPVAHAMGVLAAYNLAIIGTMALNGCAGYLLFRGLPVRCAAALVASAALMLSGPVLDQMRVGRPIFASIWITCAALIVAALFTDFHMLLFTGLWLGLFALWTIWRERGVDGRRVAGGLLALAMLALPFGLIFYPALVGAPAAGIAAPSPREAIVYSYRWSDYLTPSVMPRVWGGYELLVAVACALVMVRHEPRLRFWLLGAGMFLVLALGPTLKFTGMPLPFSLLSTWPPLGQFRSPYRLTIPAVIGLAAVAALVLDRLLGSVSHRMVTVVVVAAPALRLFLAIAQHPLSTQEYPRYDAYERIGEEASRAALIEVPFGVRSGIEKIGNKGEFLQYYQHVHRRPIINAMVARLPQTVFEFYRGHPSLMLLAGERVEASDEAITSDFDDVLDLTAAGYVLVHGRMVAPELAQRVERFLDQHRRLDRTLVEGDLVVYKVSRPSADGRAR